MCELYFLFFSVSVCQRNCSMCLKYLISSKHKFVWGEGLMAIENFFFSCLLKLIIFSCSDYFKQKFQFYKSCVIQTPKKTNIHRNLHKFLHKPSPWCFRFFCLKTCLEFFNKHLLQLNINFGRNSKFILYSPESRPTFLFFDFC